MNTHGDVTADHVERGLSIDLPPAVISAIAEQVATILTTAPALGGNALSASLPLCSPNEASSPYMSVEEAAEYLRCPRQRVDDLLSQRRLSRVKEGSRTLIVRAEIEAHLVRHPRREP